MKNRVRSKMKSIFKLYLIMGIIVSTASFSVNAQEYLEPTSGPPGHTSRVIAVHPDGSLFITSEDGSYYQSTDLGESWVKKSERNFGCEDMVITEEGEIFVGGSSVAKSVDHAVTWSDANTGLPPASVTILSMVYDSVNSVLLAGTYHEGIYKTKDGGASWDPKTTGMTNWSSVRVLSMFRHTNGDIYAAATDYGDNGYIYKSTDIGETWTVISDPLTDKSFTDVIVTEDERIFVTTWNGSVYRSDNGGVAWSDVSAEIDDIFIGCIGLLPSDVLLVGTNYGGLYRSADYGTTWQQISDGIYGAKVWDIVFDGPSARSYVSMANAGIFRSDEVGLTWSDENEGLANTDVRSLLVNDENTLFVGVYGVGVFRSYDQGQTWKGAFVGMENATVLSMVYKPGYLFASTLTKGAFVSTNEGDQWTSVGLGNWVIDALEIGSNGEIFAGNAQGKIFKSTNNGTDWDEIFETGVRINNIVLNKNSNFLFAGMLSNGGVLRSTNGGDTWTPVNNNLGSTTIWAMAASTTDQTIYVSTDDGIYKTTNNGDNWYKPLPTIVPNYNPSIAVNSLGEVFVGSNGDGLFRSRDNAENFELVTEEPIYNAVQALTFDLDGYLYAGTGGYKSVGVWKSIRPTTERQVRFAVKMKNEDGFNPSTKIVVAGGNFNNWGEGDDLVLSTSADEELTYTGTLSVTDTTGVITNSMFEYKYAVSPDSWERIGYNRAVAWDGRDDLVLDTVWFSNQKEFTRMNTSVITVDGTESRGVAWADYNNDGFDDVIIVETGSTSRNDLYKNNGDGTFSQITDGPIGTDIGDSRTACWGDYNNDGNEDLYITNLGSENNFLYKNNGDGSFSRITTNETVNYSGKSVGAVWADFNNDGFLDLFVTNSEGELNYLFMNNQDESFTKITGQSIVDDIGDSRGCAASDFDNDGDIDVFVANAGDGDGNTLYINDGEGNFTGVYSGPIGDERNVSSGGSWGDFNNDGWLDLYVTNRNGIPNTLFKNDLAGSFVTVGTTEMPADSSDSRGSAWMDYDNDGLLDLFVGNSGDQPNFLYKQRAGGIFSRIILGPVVEDPNIDARGTAWGDFNNDGSPDLILGNHGGSNPLYRNNISENHFIQIKLRGTQSNSSALGAIVLLYHKNTDGNTVLQRRDILGQSGYLSQNSSTLTFGLEQEISVDSIVVFWPGGMKETLSDEIAVDRLITITESNPLLPPPVPILSSPINGSTNIVVNPTLTWNPAGDATQYHYKFADNNTFSPLMYEDTAIAQTSKQVSGLQYDQSYYWQVRAKNEAGWGAWSQVWSFTTQPFSGTLSEPNLTSPANEEQGVSIPAHLSWTSAASGTYHVQVSEDDQFTSITYDNATVTMTEIFVDGSFLDYNTTYHWRVNVTVSDTISPWSTPRFFTTYTNVIQASTTKNFPEHDRRDEFSSSDYLMVGLPGNADVLFRDVFGDGAGQNWMAYWDNGKTGSPTEYFVAYDGTDLFKFRTGEAFWIIHNGNISVNQNIPIATLNEFAQAEVDIHSGWNMITNPFRESVSWDEVKEANGITADIPLYRYDRANRRFIDYHSLESFEGFYFDNPADTRTSLLIPHPRSLSKLIVHQDVIWELDIELTSGETRGASTRIGVAANAEIGLDEFDYRKPHALADLADIYFVRPEWDSNNSRYGCDIRPEINEVEVWDFQAYTPQKNESRLTFPGLSSIPEEYEVYLIDKTHLIYQDLRNDNKYEFVSTPEISIFEIIIGDAEAVNEQLETVIPLTYTLGQNYPNPFNPTTTIPLTLPEKSEVTLKVFNLLGQEVVTLFNGTLNAGRHFFIWEGMNQKQALMPSGIYIYQMKTNTGFRFAGKMVLIK